MSMEPETERLGSIERSREVHSQVPPSLELADRWILSRYSQTVKTVTENLEQYEFGEAARALYAFVWSEFCDWYVEIVKIRLYGSDDAAKATVQQILGQVLAGTMKLLHPLMPFITEEIWSRLDRRRATGDSLMVQPWPKAEDKLIDPAAEEQMGQVMEIVRAIRNIRAEFNVPHSQEVTVVIKGQELSAPEYVMALAKVGKIERLTGAKPKQAASAIAAGREIYVPLAGLIDFDKERERLKKELTVLSEEAIRLKKLLADEKFTAKAPPEAVAKQQERLKEIEAQQQLLKARQAEF
jgi:valyl-tRNA synthetase